MKVTIVETMRSLLYLPYYLAQTDGTWHRVGLNMESLLSPDAASAPLAVLAGDADVYIGGPARVMLNHDADSSCPFICFGLIVARNPFVLVGASPNPRFTLRDLTELRLGVANEAPTPWLMLKHALREAGVDPDGLTCAGLAPMAENWERFQGGDLDVIQTMEPFTDVALEAGNHILYRGSTEGEIGFSSFVTTLEFAQENADLCSALLRGLAHSQSRLFARAPAQIAREVGSLFAHLDHAALTRAITRYRAQAIWARQPHFSPAAYDAIGDVMVSGGAIAGYPPYAHVVRNAFVP